MARSKVATLTQLGPFIAFLGTSASMVALINNVVAGAGIALLINALFGGNHVSLALSCGAVSVAILTAIFLAYQRWRFSSIHLAMQPAASE